MINKLIILIIGCSLQCMAQKDEIGIAVLNYSVNAYHSEVLDGYRKNKALNLQAVLTYNHINKNSVDFNIQVGYFYNPQKEDNKNYSGSFYEYQSYRGLSKSIFLKPGIAKRFEIEKLSLIAGINIPFEYCFYNVVKSSTRAYDKTTNIIFNETYFYNNQPNLYNVGLNMHLSFYYEIFRNFNFGADFNLGYQASVLNGNQHYKKTYIYYDTPLNNQETEQFVKYKHSMYNTLNFQPTVGVRYCFLKKK